MVSKPRCHRNDDREAGPEQGGVAGMSKADERVHMQARNWGTAICEERASTMATTVLWPKVKCDNCRAERRLMTREEQAEPKETERPA